MGTVCWYCCNYCCCSGCGFFFKQKTAYEMRISDWSSDVCSSDLGKDPLKVLNKIELDNKKMFRREIEMYGNIIEDIRDIMIDYFDYWEGEVKPIKGPDRKSVV